MKARSLRTVPLILALSFALSCSSTEQVFPSSSTLRVLIQDGSLVPQVNPGIQVMVWDLEALDVNVPEEATFDFLAAEPPCTYVEAYPSFSASRFANHPCGAAGFVIGTGTPITATVHLVASRMEVRRASRIDLPAGGDFDIDGIVNEDDNCPLIPNPGQEDGNDDGFGDACSVGEDAPTIPDTDGDGVSDGIDNCLWVSNPPEDGTQLDSNDDGIGDVCEEIADVVLPAGRLDLELESAPFTPAAGAISLLTVEFDDTKTLDCDDAFTVCTLLPEEVTVLGI